MESVLIRVIQTEIIPKGTYLCNEGKKVDKDSKIFLLQEGECVVEKRLQANPQVNSTAQKVAQVAIVGKF